MNEARQKVEAFKKNASQRQIQAIRLTIKYPERWANMSYHDRIKAENIAYDNAIATGLGVTLNDHNEWPDEQGKQLAKDWASKLPDQD